MNLYPQNAAPAFDLALFRNPTAEYRGGAPVLTSTARTSRSGSGALLARYQVMLRDGLLRHYLRVDGDQRYL